MISDNIRLVRERISKSAISSGLDPKDIVLVAVSKFVDLDRIRQALDYLFRMIGVEYSIKPEPHGSFIPGRVASVLLKNQKIGFIGEIRPEVLINFGLDLPVAAFEVCVDLLYELYN